MPPADQPPEQRIRAYLETHGRTQVSLDALLSTWGRGTRLSRVAGDLRRAGIAVEPELESARSGDRLTLRLTDAAPEPEREPEPAPVVAPEPAPREPAPAAPGELREPIMLLLGGGAVVTVIALFMTWFHADSAGVEYPDLSSAWQWYGVLDVYLLLVAVAATALAGAVLFGRGNVPVLLPRVVLGLAAIALLCVAYQFTNPPDQAPGDVANKLVEIKRGIGPIVAMLGLAATIAGAWLAGAQVPGLSRSAGAPAAS